MFIVRAYKRVGGAYRLTVHLPICRNQGSIRRSDLAVATAIVAVVVVVVAEQKPRECQS